MSYLPRFGRRLPLLVPVDPDPSGDTYTRSERHWYTELVRHKASGDVVSQFAERRDGGTYPYVLSQYDRAGNLLPGVPTDYQIEAATHTQSDATDDIWVGPLYNSGNPVFGQRARTGSNIADRMIAVTVPNEVILTVEDDFSSPMFPATRQLVIPKDAVVLIEAPGYTEDSRSITICLLTDVNRTYVLHPHSHYSTTHFALLPGVVLVAGEFVFGATRLSDGSAFRGLAIIGIDLTTFQDIRFTAGIDVQAGSRQHNVIGLFSYTAGSDGYGASGTKGFTANSKGIFRSDQVLDVFDPTTGAQLQRITTIDRPGEMASSTDGTQLWMVHKGYVAERFAVAGNAGNLSVTATGERLPGLLQPGCLSFSYDNSQLLVTDVAENSRELFQLQVAQQTEGGQTQYVYVDQFTSPVVYPREIVWYNRKIYKYLGANPTELTPTSFANLGAGSATWEVRELLHPQTATHRVRVFDPATRVEVRTEGNGDYSQNTDVGTTHKKYFFSGTRGFGGFGANVFVGPTGNQGYMVCDRGNCRIEFYNPAWAPTQTIEFTGYTYAMAGNQKKPTWHWRNFMVDERNYAEPDVLAQGGAKMLKNYSCWWFPWHGVTWATITTFANGVQYGTRTNANYTLSLWEVAEHALIKRLDDVGDFSATMQPSGDILKMVSYGSDGSGTGARRVVQNGFTGTTPLFNAPVLEMMFPAEQTVNDPFIAGLPNNTMPDGSIPIFMVDSPNGQPNADNRRGGHGKPHFGLLKDGRFVAKSLLGNHQAYKGEAPDRVDVFENGNNVQRAGAFYTVIGLGEQRVTLTVEKDEFGYGGQRLGVKIKDAKSRLLLGCGETRYGAFSYMPATKGQHGNSDTGYGHILNNKLYFYTGSEGAHVTGNIEYRFDDLFTTLIEHPPVTLSAWTDPAKTGLLDSFAFGGAVNIGDAGIFRLANPDMAVAMELDRYALRGFSRTITVRFSNVAANGNAGYGNLYLPLLPALPGNATTWKASFGPSFQTQDLGDVNLISNALYVEDAQFRKLLKVERVPGPNGGVAFQINGQTLFSGTGQFETRYSFFPKKLTVEPITGNRLRVRYADRPAIEVNRLDAESTQPAFLHLQHFNNKNGGVEITIADPLLTAL